MLSHRVRRAVATLSSAILLLALNAGTANLPARAAVIPDESVVPHYFGPYPNWANSPLTTTTAEVAFTGTGTGATATAQVDPVTGGINGVEVTQPGSGYGADTTVTINGGDPNNPSTATATVELSGAVTGLTVTQPGSGYAAFTVQITGGGGSGAAADATGGVDGVTLSDGGSGYTAPTVEFDLPDLDSGKQARGHVPSIAKGDAVDGMDANGTITQVVVDDPGSGYLTAPGVAIHNGTLFDPVKLTAGGKPAVAASTLRLSGFRMTAIGSGYTDSAGITVTVTDPKGTGTGAEASATTDIGAIRSVTVTAPGAGYLKPGIRKFVDDLPLTCDPATGANGSGCSTNAADRFLPLAVPEVKSYNGQEADVYVIGLVQYRHQFSADLPATMVRGYVQLETPGLATAGKSQGFPLKNELLDGTTVDTGYKGVTSPQWMGPIIPAQKDRPVRVVFRNLLPTGKDGDLFLPTDSTMMGSGMGPMDMAAPVDNKSTTDGVRDQDCSTSPKPAMCFKDNRATLHLHGGITPWISDGTPHQWITPAGESTDWPQGVSVTEVPDMNDEGCGAATDGCSTFFYTNQQSARLMFYHDHSWGITRLNVYAGEAAGYFIKDATEQKLIDQGAIPGEKDTVPLFIQDRTFVPGDDQLKKEDPTWNTSRWGKLGDFWYHHVYMPAQNPGDPTGMSAFGRWMYGPWFYPPASDTQYGPIPNPYFNSNCRLDDPATWQYQEAPYCEPEQIPGTPNVSAGMEQFNDTPLVNGVAYPKVTLQPKSYRMRMLNAANDRFFNLQWYVADPTQGNGKTEVALDPAMLKAAQTDPNVSPTPVQSAATEGPDWIQIASEGGFLPAPAVVDGQQPTTWITDPTRFDVGNVDQHSMLIAPAERADAIVDFSKYAGKTLILYNDAPAAFPARVASYDYYTGGPDLAPAGAPTTLPGYGPNTRTVMQVTIAAETPAAPFNLTKLQNAFKHNAAGTGVFESGQNPIIVGQQTYNTAYGTGFSGGSDCNAPGSTKQTCDGLVRINDTQTFGFNTLRQQSTKQTIGLEPKSLHDEMNAVSFDEFGRMMGNLGLEKSPPQPGTANAILYPYVNPPTELINGSDLPTTDTVTPIATTSDGTQIWRITHNGVDTHPIHFHLYDVQLLNRVTWDNIIIPPDKNELGWKDTVRVSPLEDTIVALRPITPVLPFEIPNSIRPLNPMMPIGSTAMFNSVDANANPTTPIQNTLVNLGWEYVYHCHILSHEEMDMMRPVSYVLPPKAPSGPVVTVTGKGNAAHNVVTWTDNSISETAFRLQRYDGSQWTDVGTSSSPLDKPNVRGERTITDMTSDPTKPYQYRVVADNVAGYGGAYASMTATSDPSEAIGVNKPLAPTGLAATLATGPKVTLTWMDRAGNESGYLVERSTDGTTFSQVDQLPARNGTGSMAWTDANVTLGTTYTYRVVALNAAGRSESDPLAVPVDKPAAPSAVTATAARQGAPNERITATWTDNSSTESGFSVQWGTGGTVAGSVTAPPNATTVTTGNVNRQAWQVRVGATNPLGTGWSDWVDVPAAP